MPRLIDRPAPARYPSREAMQLAAWVIAGRMMRERAVEALCEIHRDRLLRRRQPA